MGATLADELNAGWLLTIRSTVVGVGKVALNTIGELATRSFFFSSENKFPDIAAACGPLALLKTEIKLVVAMSQTLEKRTEHVGFARKT